MKMLYNNFSSIYQLYTLSFVKNGILYIKPTLTADRFNASFLTKGVLNLTKEGCNVNYEGWNCVMYTI